MTSFKQQKDEERKLQETAAKMDRLKAEHSAMVQLNLKKLGEEQAEDEQMLNIVVQAAVQADGLPATVDVENFALRAERVAERICASRRTREWSQVRKLFDELNARDPNPVMVAAAKRAGVELVPPARMVLVPDAPKLGEATAVARTEVAGQLLVQE